MIHNHSN